MRKGIIRHITTFDIGAREVNADNVALGAQRQIEITSADTLAALDAVYIGTAGTVLRARANASSTMPAIGVATLATVSGAVATIATEGLVYGFNFSGYVGREIYVSPDTAGAVTPLGGTIVSGQLVQVVGKAYNVSGLLLQIGPALQRGGAQY